MYSSTLIGTIRKILERRQVLHSRAVLRLLFRPRSVIRIGSGAEETRALAPTLKVSVGSSRYPIILESSWRGMFRRIGESIAKSSLESMETLERKIAEAHYEPEEGPIMHYLDPHLKNRMVSELKNLDVDLLTRFTGREIIETIRDTELEQFIELVCPICRLWGGPALRSLLTLGDTILKNVYTYSRTHVGLDRLTGVREEKILFTAEYVCTDRIDLEVIVDNVLPTTTEAKILAGTLEWILKMGIVLGGFRSRGVGYLELDERESKVLLAEFYQIKNGVEIAQALTSLDEARAVRKMKVEEYISYLRSER